MRSVWGICVSLCVLVFAAAIATADLYTGDYDGKGKGIAVKLDVGETGGGSIAYAMKTACGKSRGKVELSKSGAGLKGRRVSRGPEGTLRTVVAKAALSGDGKQVVGDVKESLQGGDSKLDGCRAKRSFSADVEQADGFVPTRDEGHYTGTGPDRLPISFDVVRHGSGMGIENLAVDVNADCFNQSDDYSEDFRMVTHITGMTGRVARDGTFYIDHTPDDNTEYEFDGELADREAKVDVIIGGYFDAEGNPNPDGPYACDSWGDVYSAERD